MQSVSFVNFVRLSFPPSSCHCYRELFFIAGYMERPFTIDMAPLDVTEDVAISREYEGLFFGYIVATRMSSPGYILRVMFNSFTTFSHTVIDNPA